MSSSKLAALAGVFLCGAVQAQEYEAVADWLEVPPGRETLRPMHGDIAVSRAGEVYVSVETEGMGVQVFAPDGRYLRSLANAPADLHGFVIRDAGDGDHLYGVSLRGQKLLKMTLGGEIVREIARRDSSRVLDRESHGRVTILDRAGKVVTHVGTNTEEGIGGNRMPPERWRTGYADGDLFVAELSTFGRVHRFERR